MTNFPLASFLLSAFALAGTVGQQADSTPATVDKLSIAQLIDDTMASARKGVEATKLRNSLVAIQQLADSYMNERGVTVDGQEIINAVGEITAKNNWQLTLSAFLEDPLIQEERKVKAGLFVLSGLSSVLRTVDNDKQVNTLVAAVGLTAKSLGRSVGIGEILYNYKDGNIVTQEKSVPIVDGDDYKNFHNFRHNGRRGDISRRKWKISITASGGKD